MPNLADLIDSSHLGSRPSRVVSDGHKTSWLQHRNQCSQQFLAGSTFSRPVRSVTERIVRLMRMKRKDIPQKYRSRNQCQHAPDDSCRSLSNGDTCCRAFDRQVPARRVDSEMDVIGQRQPSSPATAMSEISTDPQRVDLRSDCRLQKFQQGSRSTRGRIIDIMYVASIAIRIKNMFEP
jgi:hypothetical protein